jgi:hypothetical protein
MSTLVDRIRLGISLALAICLILVAAQAIVTMRDIRVSLRQTQVQHEHMLKDHQAQMRQLQK